MLDAERSILNFNRACHALCVLWLFVAIPITFFIRPTYQDFSLYYMAGVCARTGNFDALYPNVPPHSPELDCDPALLKPKLLELAREWHVDLSMPYIQPAWNAIFFVPLTFFSYRVAHAIWIAILIVCTYGITLYAARIYERCVSRPSRMGGVVMLIVALSALAYRTILVGNVSAVVGFALVFTAMDLMQRDRARSAIAIWIGGLLKYATIVFLPIVLVLRRWKTLVIVTLLGIATIACSVAIAGRQTFSEYSVVAREVNKSIRYPGNQSLHGFLLRAMNVSPVPEPVLLAKHAIELLVGIILLWLVIRNRERLRTDAATMCAAVVGLTAWLLIFSPLFWDHYHIYFAPFWGWMIWEARLSMARRITVILAIALAWVPLPAALWFHWPEPFGSYMLWSACLMLGLSVVRLVARTEPAVLRTPANYPEGAYVS
jgi:hypothetical protein